MDEVTQRCAAQLLDDDGVIYGCPDEAATTRGATGTHANDGRPFIIALCAEHAALADEAGPAVFTITLRSET